MTPQTATVTAPAVTLEAEDVRVIAQWLATHEPDGDQYDDPEYDPEADDWRWDEGDLYVHDSGGRD